MVPVRCRCGRCPLDRTVCIVGNVTSSFVVTALAVAIGQLRRSHLPFRDYPGLLIISSNVIVILLHGEFREV